MGYLKNILLETTDIDSEAFFKSMSDKKYCEVMSLFTSSSKDTIDSMISDMGFFKTEAVENYGEKYTSLPMYVPFEVNFAIQSLDFYKSLYGNIRQFLELVKDNRDDEALTVFEYIKTKLSKPGKTIEESIDEAMLPYEVTYSSNVISKEDILSFSVNAADTIGSIVPLDARESFKLIKEFAEDKFIYSKSFISECVIKASILCSLYSRSFVSIFTDLHEFYKSLYIYCMSDYSDTPNLEFKYGSVLKHEYYPEYVKKYLPENSDTHVITSTEADQIIANSDASMTADTTVNGISMDQIDSKYRQKYLKLQKTMNEIFHVKMRKLKNKFNSAFFRRWYGRIPSLLETYGSSAMIAENRMKGDPTQILLSSGQQYLNKMSTDTEAIFNELIVTCKKVASGGDISAKVNAVKGFCKQYQIEDVASAEPKTIKRQITNEACFRIANAILQENGVYGYTADGIVQNHKFPTCNHIVVSLFVQNAQEKAEEQPVSSIFQSPDSITIFATPEKLNTIENGYRKATNSIMGSFNPRMVSTAHKNLENNYKLFAANLTRRANTQGVAGGDEQGMENIAQTKKIAKAIEEGLVEALDIVIDQKKRCIQCVGAMYDMSGRIQSLAKRCVAALHEEEKRHADANFNTGAKSKTLNASTAASNFTNKQNTADVNGVTNQQVVRGFR